ncbi:MAG: inositol monophosphatase family protein [Patescibacteria group bacterium]
MNNKYLKFSKEIAQKAGERLKKSFKSEIANKRGTSKEVKSVFDDIVDSLIKEGIEERFPTHSYLTEESGLIKKNSPFLWIIDPLDGTGNYENHNPFYSVSIALWKNNKPVLGVVEAPSLNERFVALAGEFAYRENIKTGEKDELKISAENNLENAYFIYCEGSEKNKNRIISNFNEIYSATKDFRKVGSAALELAWIASGRAEGYITYQIPIWDIAAGLVIAKEAGGRFYNFKKEDLSISNLNMNERINLLTTNGSVSLNFNLQ